MRCPHMERMQYCPASLCITFINIVLTLLTDENHFFGKIPVCCEDMHTPLSVNALRATMRPSRLCLRPEKPVPMSRKASSVLPKRLFCVTAKAVQASGKGFAAERNGLFRIVKSPKRHVRTLSTAVRTCLPYCGRAFSALLRFLFHEKLLSIFFTFTNA